MTTGSFSAAQLSGLITALAGRYRLERELGAGGMASVWLAEDLRHARRVAIKVLNPQLSAVLGPERFLAEIRTTANLQHPHILPLFDSGEAAGLLYYVMPFVEGETLRARLERERQLPVTDAVRVAVEVADALDYAHKQGVIHRDVKPENIMLRDGRAVVADFGIALAVQQSGGARMTQTGLSLGTPQYMAPEQAMGERGVDVRADVYALGAVLYEMLAGEPPFTGPTAQAVVARVVTEDPRPLALQRRSVPAHVAAAVHRALEKLPADRFASAAFLADALRVPGNTSTAPGATPDLRATRARRRTEAALAALVVLLAAAGAWGWTLAASGERRARAPLSYVAASIGVDSVDLVALVDRFAVAADGSAIAIVGVDSAGTPGLFIRRPRDLEPVRVAGTPPEVISPAYSPDGRWIAYGSGVSIMRVPVEGGTPIQVARDPSFEPTNLSWSVDDRLRFTTGRNKALLSVAARGGVADSMVFGVDTTVYRGEALPRGRLLLSLVVRDTVFRLAVREPDGATRDLLPGFSAKVAPTGHLLFSRREGDGWTLMSIRFDPTAGHVSGEPRPLQRSIAVNYATPAAATTAGDVVLLSGRPRTDRRLVLIDRRGVEREVTSTSRAWLGGLAVSPDGRRIAGQVWDGARRSIWAVTLATGAEAPVTREGDTFQPLWTPDGQRLAYTHFPLGDDRHTTMWHRAANGSGSAVPYARHQNAYPRSLSRDGRLLLFMVWSGAHRGDLWGLALDTAGARPQSLLATPANEDHPMLSPDGRWLAYATDASGRLEARVGAVGALGDAAQITTAGGMPLGWSGARRLFYLNGREIWQVDVGVDGPLLSSAARAFRLPASVTGTPAVLPDGEHVVAIRGGRIYSDVVVVEGALAPPSPSP